MCLKNEELQIEKKSRRWFRLCITNIQRKQKQMRIKKKRNMKSTSSDKDWKKGDNMRRKE